MTKHNGFTLIELMITLVIVVILAATGYNSFYSSQLKTYREEAKSGLTNAHAYVERVIIENNQNDIAGITLPIELNLKEYEILLKPTTGSHGFYFLQATVKSSSKQINDDANCHKLILYQAGYKSNTEMGVANQCW